MTETVLGIDWYRRGATTAVGTFTPWGHAGFPNEFTARGIDPGGVLVLLLAAAA